MFQTTSYRLVLSLAFQELYARARGEQPEVRLQYQQVENIQECLQGKESTEVISAVEVAVILNLVAQFPVFELQAGRICSAIFVVAWELPGLNTRRLKNHEDRFRQPSGQHMVEREEGIKKCRI